MVWFWNNNDSQKDPQSQKQKASDQIASNDKMTDKKDNTTLNTTTTKKKELPSASASLSLSTSNISKPKDKETKLHRQLSSTPASGKSVCDSAFKIALSFTLLIASFYQKFH